MYRFKKKFDAAEETDKVVKETAGDLVELARLQAAIDYKMGLVDKIVSGFQKDLDAVKENLQKNFNFGEEALSVVSKKFDMAKSAALRDVVYPVGSIYLSYDHKLPALIFGGKWERVQDALLYAVADGGVIGSKVAVAVAAEQGEKISAMRVSVWRRTE